MTVKRLVFIPLLLGLTLLTTTLEAAPADSAVMQAGSPTLQPFSDLTAVTGETTAALSALGSVAARRVASLQFQTSGTVQGVYVQVGDYVSAGEVVADLDASDAWQTYYQALLNLESAQLSLEVLQQLPSEDDLRVARANITSAQAAYSSAANPVSAEQLAAAQISYENAVLQQQALETARRHMNGSANEIAQAEAQIGAASFNTEIARLQLEELQTTDSSSAWSASIRIRQAQLQLQQLQAGPTTSELANAQLAIERAQATVQNAQTALQQIQLVAPISGYVTAVNIAAGDTVSTGSAAVVISDLSQLQMTVPINELDINQVKEGMNATIQLDALSDVAIPGTVEQVGWIASTSSDGIVTYAVVVSLNTNDARVRLGMTGEATIETGSTGS